MRDNIMVVFWHEGEEQGFDWDYRSPEEIRMILECGVITRLLIDENEDGINKPYRIVGSSYNTLSIKCRQEVNIYLEEINENADFYRTRSND